MTIRPKKMLEGWPNTADWLAGGEWPSRVWFCMWWTVHVAWTDGPHHLPRSGGDLLLNVHKTPSWATSGKEGMAWYSCCRLMLSLSIWVTAPMSYNTVHTRTIQQNTTADKLPDYVHTQYNYTYIPGKKEVVGTILGLGFNTFISIFIQIRFL